GQIHAPYEVRSTRQIERYGHHGFVHGQRRGAVAGDAFAIPQRFEESTTDDYTQVFGRMVSVDLDVTRRFDFQIEQAVSRQLFDHVTQERNWGFNQSAAVAVEIDGHGDLRLVSVACVCASAHDFDEL